MSRFNVFLVVFAILMVIYLMIEGPSQLEEPTTERQYQFLGIMGEDIVGAEIRRSDDARVSIVRQPDGAWQDRISGVIFTNLYLPQLITNTVAGIPFRQLTRFGSVENLVQYELTDNPQLVVSFESSAFSDTITTYSIYVGATTPSNEEHYAVFVNERTSAVQGEWIYVIPEFYIDQLVQVVEVYAQLSVQGQGQTPDS